MTGPALPAIAVTRRQLHHARGHDPGIFAPRGTPQAVIDRLNKEINAVLEQPDVKAKLQAAGVIVTPLSVADFKQFVQRESAKYLNVIKETGVTAQ